MPDQPIVLPFTATNLFAGLAQRKGLATAGHSELTLEFVIKEKELNVLKGGIKELRVPISEIDVIRLKQGWFGSKVQIRVKQMKWLADLPGCHNGELTLHVARRNRIDAADFVQALSSG